MLQGKIKKKKKQATPITALLRFLEPASLVSLVQTPLRVLPEIDFSRFYPLHLIHDLARVRFQHAIVSLRYRTTTLAFATQKFLALYPPSFTRNHGNFVSYVLLFYNVTRTVILMQRERRLGSRTTGSPGR